MTRKIVAFLSIFALALGAACGDDGNAGIECVQNSNCNLNQMSGICHEAPSGRHWCAYDDTTCPSGYRYSTIDVGDGLAGVCVAEEPPDAGTPDAPVIDAGVDASVDAMIPPADAAVDAGPTDIVTNNQLADLVLGQPNFVRKDANAGGQGAGSLYFPDGVAAVGTRLWVADGANERLLQWETEPVSLQDDADFVVGQMGFTSSTAGATQNRMGTAFSGMSVWAAGTTLVASDTANNRVLVWFPLPDANNENAVNVLGQSNFTSSTAGKNANQLDSPRGLWTDGVRLIVADTDNHRVLIWTSFPVANGEVADVVLGWSGFGMGAGDTIINPPTASSLRRPEGVYYDGARLYVSDTGNNRVLVWNGIPSSNNAPADLVIGQVNFTSRAGNGGQAGVNAAGLSAPKGVAVSGTNLFVADAANDRVVVFSTIPATNGASATFALGQTNLFGDTNPINAAQNNLKGPSGLVVADDKLYVVQNTWHRVTRFQLNIP